MKIPKVSICIPTYNQTLYLERTLNSISIQQFKDFELIISDDSTTNDVKELVEKYKITFGDKLNYFKNTPSKGTPENWNEAIRKAKGAYIKIMHHDEWFINETSLGTFVETIDSSKADFVFCSVHVFVESTKTEWDMKPTVAQVNEMLATPALLILANIVGPPSSTIYKKELGLTYDNTLKFVVDFDFYIRVFQKTKNVVYVEVPLINSVSDAGHNVTLDCKVPDIELYEYLLMFDKLKHSIPKKFMSKFERFLFGLFVKYDIRSASKLSSFYSFWDGTGLYKKLIFKTKLFYLKKKILG